jgi:hypothetical protein
MGTIGAVIDSLVAAEDKRLLQKAEIPVIETSAGLTKKNIFDLTKVTLNTLLNGTTGGAAADTGTTIAEYIAVDAETIYTISGRGGNPAIVYYDINKNIQTDYMPSGGWSNIPLNTSFTTAKATAFIRFNAVFRGTGSLSTIQVEKGAVATAYEAYSPVLYASKIGTAEIAAMHIKEGATIGGRGIATKSDVSAKQDILTNRAKATLPFTNLFPNVWNNASLFRNKFLQGDSDCEVLLLGDSILVQQTSASTTTFSTAANLPPTCQYNHIQNLLWRHAVKNKPKYDRYDSAVNTAYTTPAGTWTIDGLADDNKFNYPAWSGEYKFGGGGVVKQSNSANASFSFTWNLGSFEKLNLIHRKSIDGTSAATITVTQGTGKIQVYNGSTWEEANGFSFSQLLTQDVQGTGNSWHLANVKLKFKRVASTGTINMTLTKGADTTSYLYFWGTERWNGNSLFFTNVARAGRTFIDLQNNFLNDVVGRTPDLVLFELPLVNEMSQFAHPAGGGFQAIVNHAHDFLYGDRAGFITTLNLKTQSNNFSNFEVICVMPHFRAEYLTTANAFTNYTLDAVNNADSTAYRTYNKVKALINQKGGYSVIDMGQVFLNEAEYLGWNYAQSVTGISSSTNNSSFTYDTVHPNDFGCYIYNKYLSPIFDFLSL